MSAKAAIKATARRVLPVRLRKRVAATRLSWTARRKSGDLVALATLFGTDKWGTHWYAQHYQRHFQHLRRRTLVLLEIGIGGYDDPTEGGESLRAWKSFFPKAQIVGIDLYSKHAAEESRIRTFQGSQDDPVFLDCVIDEIGRPDIIIDDGSHLNAHVIATFGLLFPHLKDDGIYVIEDTQTSYWPTWGGEESNRNAPQTSMGFFKALVDGLNHVEFLGQEYSPTYYDQHIIAVHFYHNLIIIEKGSNTEPSNMVHAGVLRTA